MKKLLWILYFFIVISLALTSCRRKGPTGVEAGEPEYGGTIVYRLPDLALYLDPYTNWEGQYDFFGDYLFQWDWTLDRKIWDFSTMYTPAKYWTGRLAESWETPDAQTVIVHIRKDVHWQDKPPVNGREFTAYDVQEHYDRIMGKGKYKTPCPRYAGRLGLWDTITAKDKYTVEFKFVYPTAAALLSIMELAGQNYMEPPEWVALGGPPSSAPAPKGGPPGAKGPSGPKGPPSGIVQKGPLTDWHNAVGTGPWILTDFVTGSSATYDKNPNYWAYDERNPENRLPYADNLKVLCIPDESTALAALRTGKIDFIKDLRWQQATYLAKSNPELQQAKLAWGGPGPIMRVDKAPFTDIKVRKALQMAIDREAIAKSHYGGTVEGIPCGVVSPAHKGYNYPYEEWPQALKDEYSYNPDKAKKLLAEAGYPKGFETNIVAPSAGSDPELAQIVKSYFKDIGVDMEIRVMDMPTLMGFTFARKHNQMNWSAFSCGRTFIPQMNIAAFSSTDMANYGCVKDPAYDEIYQKFLHATDEEEAREIVVKAVKYALEKHWTINICSTYNYNIYQPYLKGYTNELVGRGAQGWIFSRLWIDQDMKDKSSK